MRAAVMVEPVDTSGTDARNDRGAGDCVVDGGVGNCYGFVPTNAVSLFFIEKIARIYSVTMQRREKTRESEIKQLYQRCRKNGEEE
jgi:hypothetical protein